MKRLQNHPFLVRLNQGRAEISPIDPTGEIGFADLLHWIPIPINASRELLEDIEYALHQLRNNSKNNNNLR